MSSNWQRRWRGRRSCGVSDSDSAGEELLWTLLLLLSAVELLVVLFIAAADDDDDVVVVVVVALLLLLRVLCFTDELRLRHGVADPDTKSVKLYRILEMHRFGKEKRNSPSVTRQFVIS